MTTPPAAARARDRLEILYSYPHPFGAPGIGWTAWNQVAELVADGHRVHLVAASIARPVDGLASLRTSLAVGGIRVPHRLMGRARAFAHHDRVAAARLDELPLDLVHAWPLAAERTFRAARAAGVAAVREVPNTHTANAYAVAGAEAAALGVPLPRGHSHANDPRRLAEETREMQAATALLVPSDAVRRSFLERGFDPRRLLRHRYGYRPAWPVPDRVADRPFTAVFLGRGEPRKGLHYALRAWAASSASRDGRFRIYGDLDLVPGYRSAIAPLLEAPGVELAGFTPDVPAALAEADVLLLPSVEEGSALVTYEAQAAGVVPLVSSAAGALMVHRFHGLVHEPRDVAALTAHLDELHSDRELLERMGSAAAAHASELTWTAANCALVSAYRRAIAAEREVVDAGAR